MSLWAWIKEWWRLYRGKQAVKAWLKSARRHDP
jgi:hypothetical protein